MHQILRNIGAIVALPITLGAAGIYYIVKRGKGGFKNPFS